MDMLQILKRNNSGKNVVDLQRRLKQLGYSLGGTGIDGIFGKATERAVKEFQQDRGLDANGIIDSETWQELVDAGYKMGDRLLYLKYPPFRGDDVKVLQYWLKSLGFYHENENGIFCEKTQAALIEFQKNMNLAPDGIAGKETMQNLARLKRIIEARESSNFPFNRKFESRKKQGVVQVILDYGEDLNDLDENSKYYKEKIYICRSIVNFCKEYLEKKGIKTVLTINGQNQNFFVSDRIEFANNSGSDLLISVSLAMSTEEAANGSSCYYFKGLHSYSVDGKKIAYHIQDNLVSNMGILDCRIHGTSYRILKETVMTSVMVEPAFITNGKERKKLGESSYQLKISENIGNAIIGYLEK
ncbi:MAG: peptidoglycan-binding protein [Candidatus Humimicrobiaceae bacterium]